MSNGRAFRRRVGRNTGSLATVRLSAPSDDLIAYGATCTWFGPKRMVATTRSGMPCCPHCGRSLFEIETDTWWAGAERAESEGRERYVEFLRWLQGREARCRPMNEFEDLYRDFLTEVAA